MEQTDENIVDMFLQRNEDAIRCVKEKYGNRIRRVAYEITGDFQISEECENDTYLAAWNAIPPNEPYEYLYAFLIRIARNNALNIYRRSNAKKRDFKLVELSNELQEVFSYSQEEFEADDQRLELILNRFLRAMREEQRKIFVRRYWYLDSISEIAEGYGISESKVKSSLFRSRKKLQTILRKEGYNL